MQAKDFCNRKFILTSIGAFIVIVGVVLSILWIGLFEYMMAKEMKLAPKSKSYELWKKPPLPLSLDIYLFNWTNPEQFTDNTTKPILVELGPYKFTEIPDKVNIKWHPDNSTVSFKKKSTYYFNAKESIGSLDDIISTLNIVSLAAGAKALNWSGARRIAVSLGLSLFDTEYYVTKTVREILFEGYSDDLIDIAIEMPSFLGDKDLKVPFDRFGWFYPRNGSADLTGHFNMHTGQDDIGQIGVLKQWEYNDRTDFFEGSCGMINGSSGEFFPPRQTRDAPISFFTPDLCRSISLDYETDVVVNGIDGYKYSGGTRTVDNGTLHPENKCFCNGECVPSGVINITACRFGTPVFMSFPHFYAADPFYVNQVVGLNPSKENHEFFMTLEPMTGVTLDVAARFQVNLLVQPISNVTLYENVPRIFFPVMWFEQKVTITPDMASEVRMATQVPLIGYICIGIIIFFGLIMMIWFPVQTWIYGDEKETNDSAVYTNQQPETKTALPEKNGSVEHSPLLMKNGHIQVIRTPQPK